MRNRIRNAIDITILGLFILILAGTFASKNFTDTQQFGLVVAWLFFIAGIITIFAREHDIVLKEFKKLSLLTHKAWLFWALVIVYQLILIRFFSFQTGYDAGIVREAAMGVRSNWYFSINPNNLGLLYLERLIFIISKILGIHNFSYMLNAVNLVFIDGAILMMSVILRKYTNKKIIWALLPVTFIISPWVVVAYSDTFMLPLLACLLWIIQNVTELVKKHQLTIKAIVINGLSFGGLLFFAYQLRPTILIIVVAIGVEVLFSLLLTERKQKNKRQCLLYIIVGMATVIGLFGVLQIGKSYATKNETLVNINKNVSFTPTHFIMMGMSTDSQGGFSMKDYDYSLKYAVKGDQKHSQGEEDRANIRKIKKRLKNFGVTGYLKFLALKYYRNTSDGTLAWANDSSLYSVSVKKHSVLYSLLHPYGSRYSYFRIVAQILWIFTMIGVVLSLLDSSLFARILRMSFIGLLLFLLIFEGGRSRYMLQFIPIIGLLSMIGWSKLKALNLPRILEWHLDSSSNLSNKRR